MTPIDPMPPDFEAVGFCPTDKGLTIILKDEETARNAYEAFLENGHEVELTEDRIILVAFGTGQVLPTPED